MLVPELRLYNAAGVRQPLPESLVTSWGFELLERGGYGSGNLGFSGELDDRLVALLPAPGWRLDVLFNNQFAYRGWADKPRAPIAEDPLYRVEFVGLMGRLDGILADCAFARPGGSDVSEVFAWLAATKLSGDEKLEQRGAWSQVIEADIGYSLESASFFGRTVRESFDALASASADKVVWGFDCSADGSNRLYVRSRPESVTDDRLRFRVGRDISFLELAEDVSELTNAVRFRGGTAKVPNLCFNPSWELPIQPGETASGSLLEHASFEAGAASWTLAAGASIENSDGNPGTYARTGNHWLKLSGTGNAKQVYDIPSGPADVGSPYKIELYHALVQASLSAVVLNIKVEELNNSGTPAVVATPIDEDVDVTARSYQQFHRSFTIQDSNTHHLRVTISRVSGSVNLMVDDVFLYSTAQAVQDGWKGVSHGSGEGEVDWANQEDPWHGTFCLRVKTTGCDGTNSNTFRLRPTADHWISCRRRTKHVIRLMIRTDQALDFRLGRVMRNGNRVDTEWDPVQTTTGDGAWHEYESRIGTGAGERFYPVIELQENGVWFLDALYVFEDDIIADSADVDWYFDDESVSTYWRVDDAEFADLPADILASITTYGLWERTLEVDEIDDLEAGKRYVAGFFRRFGKPAKRGSLVLDCCTVHARFVDDDGEATPMGMVAMDGARDAIDPQFPTRILYSGGKGSKVTLELELTNRRPDPALLLAKALSNSSGRGGGGGGGGAGSGQGGGDIDEDITGDLVVMEDGVAVSSGIGTLDFGPGFDVTESPAGEANVALDLSEGYHPTIIRVRPPSSGSGEFLLDSYQNNGKFTGRRAEGTVGAETATATNQALCRLLGVGHDGTGWVSSASAFIEMQSANAFSGSAQGARMLFLVTAIGALASAVAEAMRIGPDRGVNIGGAADNHASALLQVDSTSRGAILPRMTTTQRDNIASPAAGLEIFNVSTNKKNFYNGSAWEVVTSA